MITQQRLKELLNYDPKTGVFTWATSRQKVVRGEIAGCLISEGYITIRLDYRAYLAHRLAWLYVHGYFPENQIDHKDQVKSNNRIRNLRVVSSQCNLRNTPIRRDNTSGVKGVGFCSTTKKWRAYICLNNKTVTLGVFKCKVEAVANRLAAEQCLDWNACEAESSAYKFINGRNHRAS